MASIRELARTAGLGKNVVHKAIRGGLLPWYHDDRAGRPDRAPADIPDDMANAVATVLRHGAWSPQLGAALREDPRAALDVAEALRAIGTAALDRERRPRAPAA